nr:MAG TPA: Protein of unknown function (DUF1351) [Caudoviricetes sp.]
MNELQVVVQQTPGTVTWNYEDLKKAITDALVVFKTTDYDASNIGQAKKDRAMLNALSKSVNARKIEIKKKCLEPFELIDSQAKELMAIIQEPIAVIDERLTEYENARKKKARAVILEYMEKAFEGIEQEIADKAKESLYDVRWENATAKKSEWQSAIDARADAVRTDLQVLEGVEDGFRIYAKGAYRENLRLADAMQKVQELRDQEAAILKRQQEEERKKREEEERRRQMEELSKRESEQPQSDTGKAIESIEREAYARAVFPEPVQESPQTAVVEEMKTDKESTGVPVRNNNGLSQVIRITGSPEEYRKVIDYIKAMGISYEEV